MSKSHRGKGISELASHGRGECPVCERRNVKILYEQEAGDKKVKICKTCKAAIKNGKKSIGSPAAETAPVTEAPPAAAASAAVAPAAVAAESTDAAAADTAPASDPSA